jgi:predicted ATP-binding protein involved in virulence
MELVYLWVENYKNIEKQGFNFSPRFRCEYDEEKNELEIIDKDETGEFYPKNFFGDNINITAIVGENGSGKSSIVECLEKLLTFDRMQNLINLENSKYILVANLDKNLIISSDIEKLVYPKICLLENEPTKWLDLNMVKYNAELPYVEYNKMKYLENNFIRTSNLYQAKKFHLIAFDSEQIASKIIELNIKSFENITHLFFPKYFIMNETDNIDKYFILYPDGKASMWNCGHGFDSEDIDPKSEKVLNRISSVKEIFAFKKFIEFVEESLIPESNINLYLDEIISSQNIFKCISKILNDQNNYSIDEFISFFKRHSVNKLISDIDKEEIHKYLDYLSFEIINDKNIEFSSLSYGEKTFFVTILNLVYQSKISNNNLIFFLDEIEISLHPNWQKTILKDIVSIFDKTTKHIHFILNSHSSFILSDLPKENIIFLEKGKQVYPFDDGKQTFGANIHTLLSHGFFMKDGLMGEFAKEKIQSIIKYHEKILVKELTKEENKKRREEEKEIYDKEHKTQFWQIQSIIGDDYLRQVIKNHLIEIEKILYDEYLIDKEIKKLEDEINRLKRLKK